MFFGIINIKIIFSFIYTQKYDLPKVKVTLIVEGDLGTQVPGQSVHDAKDKGALEPVLALEQSESGLGLMLQSMLNLFIEATTCVKGTQGPHRVCLMET